MRKPLALVLAGIVLVAVPLLSGCSIINNFLPGGNNGGGLPGGVIPGTSVPDGAVSPSGGLSRTSALGDSAHRSMVGTAVATSSSTGQTSVPRSALMSELLPCLNSPTTRVWNNGSTKRRRVFSSRWPRSLRW
jgi:hypothetical protein